MPEPSCPWPTDRVLTRPERRGRGRTARRRRARAGEGVLNAEPGRWNVSGRPRAEGVLGGAEE
eukprot:9522597-Alexandrium_andersonii.AAC.1